MIIYRKLLYFFRVFLVFVLILSLFSCNMNSKQKKKDSKLSNVEFKINKKIGVQINE
jgi:hypothetical protein